MSFWVRWLGYIAVALGAVVGMKAQAPTTMGALSRPGAPVAAKDPYAGEALVVERLDSVYRYNADGTGTKLDTDVARLQTEAAVRAFGVLSIPYATGSQRVEIVYLRVRKANGTVVETPATDAQDQPAPVTQAAPFYSDLHLMQIPVRGLAVGDRLEYQVRTVFTRAEAQDEFWGAESFGQGVVVLERSVELRVPSSKFVQVSSPRFPAKVSEEGGERVYRWTGAQLEPTPKPKAGGEEAGGPENASAKDGKEQNKSPIAWTTFHNWAEVGEWYRGLALDRSTPTPALKAKADELVYGLTTPEAKIRALYAYVSSQVRYISVSLGIGRYQPHAAAEVLANQYGDCKDKHTLLAALLRAEGLPVSTVLIGSGIALDEAVPAPGWFNHEITLVDDGAGGDLWLDTTPEVAPYRMLDASLRDKPALVIPAKGTSALRRTPAEPPFAAFTKFEAAGTLTADGEMKAHVDVTMRGDNELIYREGLRALTPAQWDRLAQFYAQTAGFSGDPSNTVADRPEKTDTPLHMGYDYTRKPYGDWDSYRIIPLQPLLNLPLADRKTAPAQEIDFGGKHTESSISKITLPVGFGADLPPGLHVHTDFATLDKTYRLEKAGDSQVLVTERALVLKQAKLPASQWTAYRKFLDDEGDSKPWVQLTSVGAHGAAGRHPPAAGENNPVAADLVQKAWQDFQRKDWTAAAEDLDKAKAANERQAFLWSEYGYLAIMNGKLHEAAEDYHRELKNHPDEAEVSRRLAELQLRETDEFGATKTLQAALAIDGKDEETIVLLAAVQGHGDLGAAEKTLRDGLTALPDSNAIKLALGSLLLKRDKTAEGARLLSNVVSGSEIPLQVNDAAYALGDASLDLPLAEAGAGRAIHLLNVESARGETGLNSPKALDRSRLLVAAWDTYGWILFREQRFSEAETWLRAGWVDGYGVEPGMHYAMLLRKQGRTAEAERILRLLAARERGTHTAELQHLLQQGPHGALRTEATAGRSDGNTASADRHTFDVIRPAGTPAGSAVFEMDYSLSGPTAVRFVFGDDGLASFSTALNKIDTGTLIPPGSLAHLLRRGILRCSGGPSCTLLLLPVGAPGI